MLSVAPMIGWTDRNYRFMIRQITKETQLYTEMVMDHAILHNPERLEDFIGYDRTVEPPLAVQLGGSDPESLGRAVDLCESYGGFNEINLNSGCPSNKAKKAGFGAELMLEPELVRQITHTMTRHSSSSRVTVKCRLGTNKLKGWDHLVDYVEACKAGGVRDLIVHARICILSGLTPAQNRTIPPLDYDMVHRLVERFPDMRITLNGGIKTFSEADYHLGRCIDDTSEAKCDFPVCGVMIGREAYNNPFLLATADSYYFGRPDQGLSRREIIEKYFDYCDNAQSVEMIKSSTPILCKPLHNFFHGCPTNKAYKIKLDERA